MKFQIEVRNSDKEMLTRTVDLREICAIVPDGANNSKTALLYLLNDPTPISTKENFKYYKNFIDSLTATENRYLTMCGKRCLINPDYIESYGENVIVFRNKQQITVSKETAKFCAELINKPQKNRPLDLNTALKNMREQRRKQELQKEMAPLMAKMFAEKSKEFQKYVQDVLKKNEDANAGLSCLVLVVLFLLFLIALILLIILIKIW
ncbi:MAG: hypothetical protein ACI392_03635 [Paludibacteraceae bacterium]